MTDPEYVPKACAYITRTTGELLVFEGPGHDGLQIPKGTLEPGESPREALFREVMEESGLSTLNATCHLTTDVWTRRKSPPKRYVRHFFHATVHEPRDGWTHTVTDGGEEHGSEFELYWVQPSTGREFVLDLDDYLHLLPADDGGAAAASD
ncbi:DNA mismatch repair protein MutT [Halobiforma lacisalsi AJ5]|uniref:DNA mismatch repair protein MutT n=1 Tax=Natronobacterium lacisalsi AJ5 TaxID=358396 RepID=M0LUL7_NATLA|nr:NUDIX domain-containing protein [Halobiforma lacisalsi]APW97481.1 DNA mismatch repair protein MutT [Halobiforma lacisalsi AJ5]EMA37141.1 NUDIX hydrolase [Halobiforma lacisalsi AJ5]